MLLAESFQLTQIAGHIVDGKITLLPPGVSIIFQIICRQLGGKAVIVSITDMPSLHDVNRNIVDRIQPL